MKTSRWVILALALAVAAALVAKQSIKRRSAAQTAVTAQVSGPHPVASQARPEAGRLSPGSQQPTSTSVPEESNVQRLPGKPRTEGSVLSTEPAAGSRAPAGTHPASSQKPVGPLPGSKLAECLKSGRPTMADFGRGWCKPCKAMVPVLKQASQEYWDKANVVFVEIDDYVALTRKHRIAAMPTQIFFDAKGKEVTRHMGYIDNDGIDSEFAKMGLTK